MLMNKLNSHSFPFLRCSFKMSATSKIEMNNDMLDVVDSWLGQSGGDEKEVKQPVFEKRPQRLGLGAKYVPHKRVLPGESDHL